MAQLGCQGAMTQQGGSRHPFGQIQVPWSDHPHRLFAWMAAQRRGADALHDQHRIAIAFEC